MLCANFTTVPRLCPKLELQIRDLIEALQDINKSVENCEQSSWTLSRILCIRMYNPGVFARTIPLHCKVTVWFLEEAF